jgi:hypothetical protein
MLTCHSSISSVISSAHLTILSYSSLYLVESEDLRQLQERIAAEGRQSDFFVHGSVGKLEGEASELETYEELWRDLG